MKMNRYGLLILLFCVAVISLGLSAMTRVSQAGEPIMVDVTLKEFSVVMSRTDFPAGVPIQFNLVQMGSVDHEVVLEIAGENDEPLEIDAKEAEAEDITPGETRVVTWTITEPGKYQLACHVPGHYEGGMVATFTVSKPGLLSGLMSNVTGILMGIAVVVVVLALAAFFMMKRRKPKMAA
jgi:uncharacterized cupredoxin-like copper-binding protein